MEDVARALATDGITALRGAFSRSWAERMREDIDRAFADASSRPGGAVGRGPERYYVEIHPGQLRGYVELVTHPWVVGVCSTILGPRFGIVELGFDVPFAGARNQPWHRDFPSPPETYRDHRLTSLAFNLTAVQHQMFPPENEWSRYASLAQQKLPQMGDISVRSALTIHRGTTNHSPHARPVLVLGVDAPGAGHAALHDQLVTREEFDAFPQLVRDHLVCRVVDQIVPIVQKHTIEGLVLRVP